MTLRPSGSSTVTTTSSAASGVITQFVQTEDEGVAVVDREVEVSEVRAWLRRVGIAGEGLAAQTVMVASSYPHHSMRLPRADIRWLPARPVTYVGHRTSSCRSRSGSTRAVPPGHRAVCLRPRWRRTPAVVDQSVPPRRPCAGFAELKRSLRERPQLASFGVQPDGIGATEDWHGGSRRLKK